MREFNEGVKEALAETRLRVAETAFNHITTSIGLFQSGAYSQAAFLAITAIEEMGKARTLQLVQSEATVDEEPARIDAKGIEKFLRKHQLKATRAAASGLSVNHGAVRRHGRHEEADLNLASGILFLTKSDQWMKIRNSCIYVDVDLHSKVVDWPTDSIAGDHSYYFICMALEIIAKESEAGFGSPIEEFETDNSVTEFQTASNFENHIIVLLHKFMAHYRNKFDETNLEFFTGHPQYNNIREKVRKKEVGINEDRREALEKSFRTTIEGIDEPSEEEKDRLPDRLSYEKYQEQILDEMLDIGMDVPYFTNQNMHPDIQELRENVLSYLNYE